MDFDVPLEPSRAEIEQMGRLVLDRLVSFLSELPGRPAHPLVDPVAVDDLVMRFLQRPPEKGRNLVELLDRLDQAVACSVESAGAGNMAYVPSSGLVTSALAELYARITNRHGGLSAMDAPALAAAEESVLRWIAQDMCGLPAGAGGLMTTGGSLATLSAIVTARHARLGEQLADGTLYVSTHTHHSVDKAARLAGIRPQHVRVVPCTPDLRMDLVRAAAMIRQDRAAGLRPFLLVASAGTTDTGTIDALLAAAALARGEDLWFHIDAAYGGPFRLTVRGRERLAGTELADSITVDPHKGLFLASGTGALVVRDPGMLAAAHAGSGAYLQDVGSGGGLPVYAQLGPELTREVRGVRLWLPLHLHGVAAFRDALDERLDLAERSYDALVAMPSLEVPWRPELSTVVFRVRPRGDSDAAVAEANQATERLLERVNASGRVRLSSTVIDRRYTVRVCILGHRTRSDQVAEALDLIGFEAASAAAA